MVLVALVSVYFVSVSAAAKANEQLCQSPIAHDYERPFARMPKLREPLTEQLPFAPPHTAFTQQRDPILVIGDPAGQQFGYSFSATPGADRNFDLNWIIITRLVEIDSHGKAERVIAGAHRRIGRLSERDFNDLEVRFSVPPKVAFYRADTIFRRVDGRHLARYGKYLRVVESTFNPRLALDSKVANRGELIQFRVNNMGTERIAYGEAFSVEMFDGSGWTDFPAAIGPWHRKLTILSAGQAGRCQGFSVPADIAPGRYRIRKDLNSKKKTLTAEFEVQS